MTSSPSSTPRHIAIILVTSKSHLLPSLALIRELVERGHRVSVAVGESEHERIAPTGAELVGHRSTLPGTGSAEADAAFAIPKDAGESLQVFLREAMTQLPYLTEHFDDDRPDLVLHDPGAMAGQVIARRYGVPAVSLSITPVSWPAEDAEPDPELVAAMTSSESARRYYELADAWLTDNGIAENAGELQSNPDGVLSLVPRILQPGAERAPEVWRFAGPCLDPRRLADRGWTPPGNGKPLVLVSLGNTWNDQPDFYRSCLGAFAGTDWHVVLVVAKKYVNDPEFRDTPDNIEIHEWVPQPAVLKHADVFVTHAGAGSCVEAFWFGVPMIAVPQGSEQFENAKCLTHLGVARHLPTKEVTAGSLRRAVSEMRDDAEATARLAKIRDEVRSTGGVSSAADAVEDYLPR
jgi:MGT family glycosyltransferase